MMRVGTSLVVAALLAVSAQGAQYNLIVSEGTGTVAPIGPMRTMSAGWPAAYRVRPVQLTGALSDPAGLAVGDTLVLDLFADTSYVARIDRVGQEVNGTLTVRGRIDGFPLGCVLFATTGGRTLAHIEVPERFQRFLIQSEQGGRHYLLDVNKDAQDMLPGGPSRVPPSGPGMGAPLLREVPLGTGGPTDLAADSPATIDVMIVYTPAARQWADNQGGGIANVVGQAMQKAQLAMDNSNTGVTLHLVYSAEISYTESGDSGTDLDRLTSTSDGYMDQVHSLRTQWGADLVSLLEKVDDTGGIGWLLNSISGDPEYAFNICRVQQVGWTYTYAHESGHNMGCGHPKDQATQPGPGIFSYSAGWHWIGLNAGKYCSVMSYGDGGYTTVGYFSNPSILYQGVATGDAVDGDNARTIRETKQVIAAYRSIAGLSNDMFANAITISGSAGQTTGSNQGATKESGEPDHAQDSGGKSVWWNWTAPGNGQATINTFGSNFDTLLAVYTGSSVGSLTAIASNDDSGSPQSQVTFTATSGTTYHIAVDGYGGTAGTITLNWSFVPVQAPTITTTDPLPTGTVGVTYNQTLAATGGTTPYTWSVSSGSLPSGLSLSSGGLISGTPNAAGTATFTVRVAGSDGASSTKDFSLSIAGLTNDMFANAITISGSAGQTTGSNQGATKESGEPNHAQNSGGKSVWWNWTAPGNGQATINTFGSNFDTLLAVYTGSSVGSLTAIASNDDFGGTQSQVTFTATSGTTYRIAVDGYSGAVGTITLNWSSVLAPTITTTNPLPSGTVGVTYNQTLAATGGTTPYTWSVSSGSLPSGLSLSSGGLISGTPGAMGTTNFTVRVAGSNGASSTKDFSLTIALGAPAMPSNPSPADGAINLPVNTTLTWNCTTGVTFDVYFGTALNPPQVTTAQTTTTYTPTLAAGTTYYWKVVATNAGGSTSGPIWSFTTRLLADINGDGYVNVGDLQLLVAKWGRGPGYAGQEDINGDGFVNVGDLQILVANWGKHL